jgi:hypothetical protein
MSTLTSDRNRVDWRLPVYAVLGALVLFSVGPPESIVLYLFVAAIVSLLLLNDAIGRRRRQSLLALAIFLLVSAIFVRSYSAIRDECRWLVWSHRYKVRVLAQRDVTAGELKHIEWDGWGFPGAGDTTVYLVFDPTDALSAAAKSHRPSKPSGLPCEVPLVRRLERHWYAVRFYTDERWGCGNAQDCGSEPAS